MVSRPRKMKNRIFRIFFITKQKNEDATRSLNITLAKIKSFTAKE
jgi:hypothetical protein